jgi:hypothetical protein
MPPTRNIAEPASRSAFRIPPRRWLQFSIRTLLAVMFAACCLAAWVAHKRDQAAQQQQAYQVILTKQGLTNFGPESARSPWLRWILGEDVAASGGCIELGGCDVNDADLAQLSSLGQLTRLSLNKTHVTDRGLVHLGKLSRLRNLSLDETQISDDGLKSLHACHSLECLSLYGTRTTPAGVESLRAALPDLRVIDRDETDLPPLRTRN